MFLCLASALIDGSQGTTYSAVQDFPTPGGVGGGSCGGDVVVVVSGSGENGCGDDDGTENEESFQESESQDWMEIVMTPKRGALKGAIWGALWGALWGAIREAIWGAVSGATWGALWEAF